MGALIALMRTKELEIPHWGVFLIIARQLLMGGLRIIVELSGKDLRRRTLGKMEDGHAKRGDYF